MRTDDSVEAIDVFPVWRLPETAMEEGWGAIYAQGGGRIGASSTPVCAAIRLHTLQTRIAIRCLGHLSPVREEYGRRQQPDAHAPQQADDGGGGPNGQRNACQGGAQGAPGVALEEEEEEEE